MISIYASRGLLIYFSIIALLFGAAMGSFLNCAAWRIAHGESFLHGRSHCPSCGHVLGVMDLIPVFSWLMLKGRCRYCHAKVSARYELTEIIFSLLTLTVLLRYDLTVECLRNYILICCLFCLSLVDLETLTIPDGCLILPLAAWIFTAPFLYERWQTAGIDLLTGFLCGAVMLGLSLAMDAVLKRESMGGGDIKLYALAGIYLGPVRTLFMVLCSCVLGLAAAGLTGRRRGEAFPFGPAIAAASAGMLFWGQPLADWYLGLLGL